MHNPSDADAELSQLADALTRQGYHATLVTPAPYLAIHLPGHIQPHMIYNSDGWFWWHAPQPIASSAQTTRAAELITWGLRALRTSPPAYGTTPAPASQAGGQEC